MHTHDFYDLVPIDPLQWGRENDPIGLLSYQAHRRRRGLIGESSIDYWATLKKELPSTDVAILEHIQSKGVVSASAKNALNHILGKAISLDALAESVDVTLAVKLFIESMNENVTVADINEAMSIQQSRDFERVMYGVMKRDEYDKKWKVGKYRPKDPNHRLDPTGVYKNLLMKKNEDVEILDEALTAQQRMRRKMVMRRIAPRLARARALAMKRRGGNDVLKRRARNLARSMMSRKLLGGRNKSDVSAGERARIEKILATRKKGIDRLATRLVTVVRQKQAKRFVQKKVKPGTVNKPKHEPTKAQPAKKKPAAVNKPASADKSAPKSSAVPAKSITTR